MKKELGPTLQKVLPFSSKDKDHPVKLSQMWTTLYCSPAKEKVCPEYIANSVVDRVQKVDGFAIENNFHMPHQMIYCKL